MSDDLEVQKVIAQRLRQFYTSPEEAALAGLAKIDPASPNELGGLVWKEPDGRFYHSEPAGNERTRKFEVRVKLPKGSTPSALFHGHPSEGGHDKEGELFSPEDVEVADRMKILSYIKAMSSGNVRKYEPGVSKTKASPRAGSAAGGRGKVSEGEIVQAIARELQARNNQ